MSSRVLLTIASSDESTIADKNLNIVLNIRGTFIRGKVARPEP
jgi:hypothetical protein